MFLRPPLYLHTWPFQILNSNHFLYLLNKVSLATSFVPFVRNFENFCKLDSKLLNVFLKATAAIFQRKCVAKLWAWVMRTFVNIVIVWKVVWKRNIQPWKGDKVLTRDFNWIFGIFSLRSDLTSMIYTFLSHSYTTQLTICRIDAKLNFNQN